MVGDLGREFESSANQVALMESRLACLERGRQGVHPLIFQLSSVLLCAARPQPGAAGGPPSGRFACHLALVPMWEAGGAAVHLLSVTGRKALSSEWSSVVELKFTWWS